MKRYHISAQIGATPEHVWQTLLATLHHDPAALGIIKLHGTIAPNARLKIWSDVSPDRAFALRVVTFKPTQLMVWRGGMPFGLFTGTRQFTCAPSNRGTTFEMSETFTGPLSGLITKSMPDLTPSFEKFASALTQKAQDQ